MASKLLLNAMHPTTTSWNVGGVRMGETLDPDSFLRGEHGCVTEVPVAAPHLDIGLVEDGPTVLARARNLLLPDAEPVAHRRVER